MSTKTKNKWGKDNHRLSRNPEAMWDRFQEQMENQAGKAMRIAARAEAHGHTQVARKAKSAAKKLQSLSA